MNNYPDNVRYRGDTEDPRSPFYDPAPCEKCNMDLDDCDCCTKCDQTKADCEWDGECNEE